MDFRPTRRALVTGYALLLVGLVFLVWQGRRHTARLYYWPEYTSHIGYVPPAESCRQCHIQPFAKFEEKTCYTAGCHGDFDPRRGPMTPEALARLEAEHARGGVAHGLRENRPTADQYPAIVAFHSHLGQSATCTECHPAHALPQRGRFNEFTIRAELEKRVKAQPAPPTPEELNRVRAEVFHTEAEGFVGRISCNACHANIQSPAQPLPMPPG